VQLRVLVLVRFDPRAVGLGEVLLDQDRAGLRNERVVDLLLGQNAELRKLRAILRRDAADFCAVQIDVGQATGRRAESLGAGALGAAGWTGAGSGVGAG